MSYQMAVQLQSDVKYFEEEKESVDPDDKLPEFGPEDDLLQSPSAPRIYKSSAPYVPAQGTERYLPALKTLIPVRQQNDKKNEIGVDDAGLFSFVFCSWLSNLLYKAHRRGLVPEDIPEGSPLDSCDRNFQRLEMLWLKDLRNHGPSGASFSRVVWNFVRTRILADWLLYLISCVLGLLTPMIFMRKLLEFAEDPQSNISTGVTWAVLLMVCEILRILFFSARHLLAFRTATRLRVACFGLTYRKVLRLKNFEGKSIGQLINLYTNDSQRIFDMILFAPMMVGAPLILIAAIIYVLIILSPWALSGIIVFLAYYPAQYFISRFCGLLRGKAVIASDRRISIVSEMLTYIRTIKTNAYEESFKEKVKCARASEQTHIENAAYFSSIGVALGPTIPIISAIVTFLTHVAAGNSLTAAQAFPFITLMVSQARNLVNITQIALTNSFEAHIGFNRLKKCLLIKEFQSRIQRPIDKSQAISIGQAHLSFGPKWSLMNDHVTKKMGEKKTEHIKKSDLEAALTESENLNNDSSKTSCESPVLQNINFSVSKGRLVGICGPVGSGKTSLLLSILGEMHLIRGQLARDGSCAFVGQQPWITSGTLRENILFGEAFISTRYHAVITCCALNEDLDQMPRRDMTQIGEKGVNLSGGQRQRVALARAVYANRDIYLLDDPLSAVDSHVGAFIFKNCIKKELEGKTVVFVTHQIQYLRHCDEVCFIREGCIVEQGSHEDLLQLDKEYASVVKQMSSAFVDTTSEFIHSAENKVNGDKNSDSVKEQCNRQENIEILEEATGDLTVDEPSNKGSVHIDTYCRYVSAAGGYIIALVVFSVFLANVGSTAFSSWWLATWLKGGGGDTIVDKNNKTVISTNLAENPDYEFYQTVYASSLGLILVTFAIRCLVFTKVSMRASSFLHNELFLKVLHSPMLFFETNPIGRMQNIFSRDMDEMDSRLPATVENLLNNFWILCLAFLFICIIFPIFLFAFIPLSILYYVLSQVFRKGIRDLKRIENSSRSPLLSKLTETVYGLNTIHAFNKDGDYIQRFFQMCDMNSTCVHLWNCAMRWLAVRVDMIAAITISSTAFLVVALHGVVAPAMAGLALSYSWHISGVLQYTTRLISELEVRFISVERILAYTDTAEPEGKDSSKPPLSSWPEKGQISFQNVSMSYGKCLPNALKNINLNILPCEKIGIVGRTGSGKSSLTVALLRLVEVSSGKIIIDGTDISNVPLHVLRSKIAMIPQDPVLFSGTIRSNLLPLKECDDKALWEALDKVRLSNCIKAKPHKLDTVISSASPGLSAGECQLLCLARAILRRCKVLVLDEATASIDPDTEHAIQTTVQEEFRQCTVLIIAHRLSTIYGCDQVLVMDDGKIAEFGKPSELIDKPRSAFAKMVTCQEVN